MKTQKSVLRRGFTLVELMTVIAIIAVLAGLGFGTFMLVSQKAAINETKLRIENVQSQLEVLQSEGIELPEGSGDEDSTKQLVDLLNEGLDGTPMLPELDPDFDGKGKAVDSQGRLIDSWGKPILYVRRLNSGDFYSGDKNNMEGGFDLWSRGPDYGGDEEGHSDKDDIKNW